MSLREDNLRVALLKAFAEWIETELDTIKAEHRDNLVARYNDEGTKSFDVKLPDGTKVAAITLSIPKDSVVVSDQAALIAWATSNDEDLVTTTEHPAVPAHTTVELNSKRLTELIARVKPVGDGAVVDPDTGAIVTGLTHKPAPDPKSYSVRYTDDGREHLGMALRDGSLAHLLADTPLGLGVRA